MPSGDQAEGRVDAGEMVRRVQARWEDDEERCHALKGRSLMSQCWGGTHLEKKTFKKLQVFSYQVELRTSQPSTTPTHRISLNRSSET